MSQEIKRRDVLKGSVAVLVAGQAELGASLADAIAAPAATPWFEEKYTAALAAMGNWQKWQVIHDKRRLWCEARWAEHGQSGKWHYFPSEELCYGLKFKIELRELMNEPPNSLADSDLQRRAVGLYGKFMQLMPSELEGLRQRVEWQRERLLAASA